MLKKHYLYILLIINCISLFTKNSNAANFQNSTEKNFSYIFVPGIISLDSQAAKYIPEFIGTSGETLTCSHGIHTLNQPLSVCTFSDVSAQSLTNSSKNPFTHFCYWITDRLNKKYGVVVKKNLSQSSDSDSINQTPQSANSVEYTIEKHAFDITKINFGQEVDINALLKTYTDHNERYPATNIILYGVSRGAATICTFMGKHQPQNVSALILEAPFDSIPHLLKHSHTTTHTILSKVLPKITSYDPTGDSPITSIETISKDIPVLIITSKIDNVVPAHCVKSLRRKFIKNGHNKVHLLVLKNSTHSGYAFDDIADKTRYLTVMHAFNKHYNLPHDPELASQGFEKWKKISGEVLMMPINS